MSRTRALIGAEGADLPQLVRLARAVLPVARLAADGPLRAQPRRAATSGRRAAATRSSTTPRRSPRGCSAPATRPCCSASTSTATGAATRGRSRQAGRSGTASSTPRPTTTTATRSTTTACSTRFGPDPAEYQTDVISRAGGRDHRAPRRGAASRSCCGRATSPRTTGYPREPDDPREHAHAGARAAPPRRLRQRGVPGRSVGRRGRRVRQAARRSAAGPAVVGRAWRRSTSTTARSSSRCWRSTRASSGSSGALQRSGELDEHADRLHLRQRLLPRRAPRHRGQGAALRALDPRAAAHARAGRAARAACSTSSSPTSTSRRRCWRRPAPSPPWEPDGAVAVRVPARPAARDRRATSWSSAPRRDGRGASRAAAASPACARRRHARTSSAPTRRAASSTTSRATRTQLRKRLPTGPTWLRSARPAAAGTLGSRGARGLATRAAHVRRGR